MKPEDVMRWFVKNNKDEQISFSSFAKGKWSRGPQTIERFNGMPSINIQGGVVSGKSSGEAMDEMERLSNMLPAGIDIAWSGLSYEEKAAGANTIILYAISVLFIFLALAALYESWSIPFAVIMTIPFGIIGSLLFSTLGGQSNDIFFQLALLTTAGLSAKNAILIVEFIKDLLDKGYDILTATKMAVMQRFRPIIMTSIAFMMGVLPLILADGAGSEGQNALGIAVFGGMMTATFILPAFVPLFFVFVQKFKKKQF
jgi:multidrug efflux pump subunit AcrB